MRQLKQCLHDVQQQPSSSSATGSSMESPSAGVTEAHLARALSGMLLMLLCDDKHQPLVSWLSNRTDCVPQLAQALRQRQLGTIQTLLQQDEASTLLCSPRLENSIDSSSTEQQQLPLGLLSPGVRARLEQVCQVVLQQVLLIHSWADAAAPPVACNPISRGSTVPGGSCGQHLAPFGWQGLVQSLHQAAESAAEVCRLQQRQQRHQPPDAYLCPISRELMCDPVVACDGHTYERCAITEWIQVRAGLRVPVLMGQGCQCDGLVSSVSHRCCQNGFDFVQFGTPCWPAAPFHDGLQANSRPLHTNCRMNINVVNLDGLLRAVASGFRHILCCC